MRERRLRRPVLCVTAIAMAFCAGGRTASAQESMSLIQPELSDGRFVKLTAGDTGEVTFGFRFAGLSGCSVHGPNVSLEAVTFPRTADDAVTLGEVICGRAQAQVVNIDRCKVDISLHGYVHIDAPYDPFLGLTTIDVSVEKTGAVEPARMRMTIYTPKGKIHRERQVPGEHVAISSCR